MTARPSTRMLLVSAVLPILAALIGIVLMVLWLPELPESVTLHWGPDGAGDGSVPAWVAPLVLAASGISLPALLTGALLLNPSGARPTARHKFLAVTSLWAGVFLAVVFAWAVGAQRGLTDAVDAPGPVVPLVAGFGIAVAAAVGGWFLLPRAAAPVAAPAHIPNGLELGADERVHWSRRVTAPFGFLVVGGAAVALLVGMAVIVSSVTDGGLWFLPAVPLLVLVLFATTAAWRVRIDARGLEARGILGLPRFTVPLERIREARVVRVDPLADFGGWGLRWGTPKRFGVVVRAGEALEVVRRDGSTLVVTVPDADRAAAVLNAMRARVTLDS